MKKVKKRAAEKKKLLKLEEQIKYNDSKWKNGKGKTQVWKKKTKKKNVIKSNLHSS